MKEKIYTICKIEFFIVKIRSEIDVAWLSVARWKEWKYFVNKKYHRYREERDSIVRKAIPCVRFGSGHRSGRGRQEKGRDEPEVSRESPVVIVVIKWRLAGRFASVVCIWRGLEGNIGWERSRGLKGWEREIEKGRERERKGRGEKREEGRGLVFVIGGAEWRSIWNTPQWNKLYPPFSLSLSLFFSLSLPHSITLSPTLRSSFNSRLRSFTLERFHLLSALHLSALKLIQCDPS